MSASGEARLAYELRAAAGAGAGAVGGGSRQDEVDSLNGEGRRELLACKASSGPWNALFFSPIVPFLFADGMLGSCWRAAKLVGRVGHAFLLIQMTSVVTNQGRIWAWQY